MLYIIVLAVQLAGGQQAKLMAEPVVAFTSEQKCEDAIAVLRATKTAAPLACVGFSIIGGVPLESY